MIRHIYRWGCDCAGGILMPPLEACPSNGAALVGTPPTPPPHNPAFESRSCSKGDGKQELDLCSRQTRWNGRRHRWQVRLAKTGQLLLTVIEGWKKKHHQQRQNTLPCITTVRMETERDWGWWINEPRALLNASTVTQSSSFCSHLLSQ